MTDALSDVLSGAPDPVEQEIAVELCRGQIRRDGQRLYWQCASCNLETMGRYQTVDEVIENQINGFRRHAEEVASHVHARLRAAGQRTQSIT